VHVFILGCSVCIERMKERILYSSTQIQYSKTVKSRTVSTGEKYSKSTYNCHKRYVNEEIHYTKLSSSCGLSEAFRQIKWWWWWWWSDNMTTDRQHRCNVVRYYFLRSEHRNYLLWTYLLLLGLPCSVDCDSILHVNLPVRISLYAI